MLYFTPFLWLNDIPVYGETILVDPFIHRWTIELFHLGLFQIMLL